jgi:hypothetical protein
MYEAKTSALKSKAKEENSSFCIRTFRGFPLHSRTEIQ